MDKTVYILGIDHEIRPREWTVTLSFRPPDTTASVAVTNTSGGTNAGPLDVLPPSVGAMISRYTTVDQSIPTGASVWTKVVFSTNDKASLITYGSGDFTVPYTGRYVVIAGLRWTANATGYRAARLAINGAAVGRATRVSPGSAQAVTQVASQVLYLNANDVVSLRASQTSGAALALAGAVGGGNERSIYMSTAYLGT